MQVLSLHRQEIDKGEAEAEMNNSQLVAVQKSMEVAENKKRGQTVMDMISLAAAGDLNGLKVGCDSAERMCNAPP